MNIPKVVVIGGGFAGLNVIKALAGAKVEVLLIDKKNHHLFQPLLYQVATAALSPADIAMPLREIFRNQDNTTVIMGNVVEIDKARKMITLKNGENISYDYLVIGVGARHSYFGRDDWEKLAPGLKTLTDALGIRERILTSFEQAERAESMSEARKYLNFAIIGGGPTGVEMAGAIAEIAHTALFRNFRRIDPRLSKVYLIEAAPRVLPPYPEVLSKRAKEDLQKMGVRVLTSTMVVNINEEGVDTKEGFIPARNVIWAAGNQASPLLKTLNTPLDKQGRALVGPDLSIPEHPEIFVIGDASCYMTKEEKPLPGIAPVAIQMGSYVGKIIRKSLSSGKRKPFSYFDKGNLATIGKAKAVGNYKKLRFTGVFAWLIWAFIHVVYLIGFRNRYAVMLNWYFHYVTGMRGARLIHHELEEEGL